MSFALCRCATAAPACCGLPRLERPPLVLSLATCSARCWSHHLSYSTITLGNLRLKSSSGGFFNLRLPFVSRWHTPLAISSKTLPGILKRSKAPNHFWTSSKVILPFFRDKSMRSRSLAKASVPS